MSQHATGKISVVGQKNPCRQSAWERRIFTKATDLLDAHDLVDAAVDIAWVRLMPNTLERPLLEIKKEGSEIVFRVKTLAIIPVLNQDTDS